MLGNMDLLDCVHNAFGDFSELPFYLSGNNRFSPRGLELIRSVLASRCNWVTEDIMSPSIEEALHLVHRNNFDGQLNGTIELATDTLLVYRMRASGLNCWILILQSYL